MPNTPLSGLPYPSLTGSNNPPADFQALANALDPQVTPQITSYAVSWTQTGGTTLAIGNGTLVGEYVKTGRLVFFSIRLTRGSTTNFGTGSYFFSLPFPALTNLHAPGTGIVTLGGTSFRSYVLRMVTSTAIGAVRTTDESFLSNTSHAWATGDTIALSGSYPASS